MSGLVISAFKDKQINKKELGRMIGVGALVIIGGIALLSAVAGTIVGVVSGLVFSFIHFGPIYGALITLASVTLISTPLHLLLRKLGNTIRDA